MHREANEFYDEALGSLACTGLEGALALWLMLVLWSVKSTKDLLAAIGSGHLFSFCCIHHSCSCVGRQCSGHGHTRNLANGKLKWDIFSTDLETHI